MVVLEVIIDVIFILATMYFDINLEIKIYLAKIKAIFITCQGSCSHRRR
jgi:hypothetical protein